MDELRTLAGLLRGEGWRAVADRLRDRARDLRDRQRFRPLAAGAPVPPVAVLSLLATPPWRRLGGVQLALLHRRRHAAASGHALLYPEGGRYRLEVAREGVEVSLVGPAVGPNPAAEAALPAPPPLEDASLAEAISWAAGVVGARVLHVENLASLPPLTLHAARGPGLALVISLHDFSAFCPRPHLLERPRERFCEYSRDAGRCQRCLRQDWPAVGLGDQEERRRAEHALLRSADRLVFPSDFLRRTIAELYDGLDPARQAVIAPALDLPPPPRRRPAGAAARLAFVGGARPHKGGHLLAEIVEEHRRLAGAGEEWTLYGPGPAEPLRRLRAMGVRVRGYYRAGSLSSRLAADGIDVAVLPSIVPETFGLTLDECWRAGCPIVAFDLGAIGERLRAAGGGLAVPFAAGAAGLAEAAGRATRGEAPAAPPAERHPAAAAAAAYRRLFAELEAAA